MLFCPSVCLSVNIFHFSNINPINNRYLFPDCIKIIFIRTEIKFRTYFTIKVYQMKL